MSLTQSLLQLVHAQKADGLELATGSIPKIKRGGEHVALSMPALDPDFMQTLVDEVLSQPETATLLEEGHVTSWVEFDDVGGFAASVSGDGAFYRIIFERAGDSEKKISQTTEASIAAAEQVPVGKEEQAQPSELSNEMARCLEACERVGATDLFVSTSSAPHMRSHQRVESLSGPPVEAAQLVSDIATLAGVEVSDLERKLEDDGAVDLSLRYRSGVARRYRANLFRHQGGLAASLRPIATSAPTLPELMLPSFLVELTSYSSGLVLMAGQAGSGKSTTLVALVEALCQSESKHILTLEDPIEYVYQGTRSLVHQREIGRDVSSFSTGLRSALRESPDVILVGEMRDHQTISAAITAAETGHLVLSTIHAASASTAVDRMIDVFPEHQQRQVRYQLADSLRAVVSSRLYASEKLNRLVPAIEVMRVNTPIATKIREQRGHQLGSEIQKGRGEGMITIEASLARLVAQGILRREQVERHVTDRGLFEDLLARGG